jgi:hypothetical protein
VPKALPPCDPFRAYSAQHASSISTGTAREADTDHARDYQPDGDAENARLMNPRAYASAMIRCSRPQFVKGSMEGCSALCSRESGGLVTGKIERPLRRTIDDDRYPMSPRLAPLKTILAKLDPPRPKPVIPAPLKGRAAPSAKDEARRAPEFRRRSLGATIAEVDTMVFVRNGEGQCLAARPNLYWSTDSNAGIMSTSTENQGGSDANSYCIVICRPGRCCSL